MTRFSVTIDKVLPRKTQIRLAARNGANAQINGFEQRDYCKIMSTIAESKSSFLDDQDFVHSFFRPFNPNTDDGTVRNPNE